MAATKRKRRGGFGVQAKKPKRNEKDAKQPAKLRDIVEEAEEEERDRIPGPVSKVERAHVPVTPAAGSTRLPWGYLPDESIADFGVAGLLPELGLSFPPGQRGRRAYS